MSKTYVLGMFPYPSGEGLHVGHVRIFTACDVMARYFRMKEISDPSTLLRQAQDRSGLVNEPKVLSPMGWDAFGLPAENAAIKGKKIPQEMVPQNYANFRRQMEDLSLSFDWERELATTDPSYYAITQWIFLQLYQKKDEQGRRLVYRDKVAINWCPKCKTGLANEEVLGDGTHERCGEVVGKKMLPQWVMRITTYAERLLHDLDHAECPPTSNSQMCTNLEHKTLDWPKGILEMQRNWIGKKEGARVKFEIRNSKPETLEVFTTRVDTIKGVSFVVVAPEKAQEWIKLGWQASDEVEKYIETSLGKSEQTRLTEVESKTGVSTGLIAVNPLNGQEVPVWVADYVLADFGTGAVMGVPQYDERDLAFAKKYNLPIPEIELNEGNLAKMEQLGVAKRETIYHLRDWVFSRQRYWGEPIPLVFCPECAKTSINHKFPVRSAFSTADAGGSNSQIEQQFDVVDKDGEMVAVVPVPESQLPLELPTLESYEPTDTGESPLSRVDDWVNTKCPNCGGPAKRETDTMPNWAGSCWYFLAFAFWNAKNPKSEILNSKQIRNTKSETGKPYTDWWMKTALPEIRKWLPVDWYLGGAEHAVLHLLYARFWVKVLQDLGLLDFSEPFLRLRSVGMVLAEDGKKMSKSLGNVVNPDDMVAKYGSDAVRMYEMFMGPWEQSIAWDSGAISGQVRFLGRVRETVRKNRDKLQSSEPCKEGEKQGSELLIRSSPELAAKLKTLVERVEEGVLNQKFNTAIAGLMEFVNSWREEGMILSKEHVEMFASLLSLFAPITAKSISHTGCVMWPDVSSFGSLKLDSDLKVTIAVQVNGKLRSTVEVSNQEAGNQESVMKIVMEDERVKKWMTGVVKKTIFVPGKLVNLVL